MTQIKYKFWWPILLHIGLTILLGWNLLQTVDSHMRIAQILKQPITAADPEAFRAQLIASGPQWWTWAIALGGLAISLGFVVLGLLPRMQKHIWWRRLAVVWLVLWAVYFLVLAILAYMALSSLFA